MSKYINIIYEEKITKLKEELKEIGNEKEKIKANFVLFVSLIKKYSNKLSFLFDKIKINNYEHEQILSTFFNLNEFIGGVENNNFSIEDKINIKKLISQNSIDESQEIEKNINEIISKYEKKINILEKQNKEMFTQIKEIKIENSLLKDQIEEEKNIKENVINKLNMMKDLNNNLEKKNKILDSKCKSYFNQSTRNKYEQKNFEDEINYKNKIIKYLENLLQKKDYDTNDEIIKKINERDIKNINNINNINKIMDLKKNLKKVINVTKNINNDEIEKSSNYMNSNEKSTKKFFINDGSRYLNEKSITSYSNKTNNARVKKEIDLLDKEIEKIQNKLESMVKNE